MDKALDGEHPPILEPTKVTSTPNNQDKLVSSLFSQANIYSTIGLLKTELELGHTIPIEVILDLLRRESLTHTLSAVPNDRFKAGDIGWIVDKQKWSTAPSDEQKSTLKGLLSQPSQTSTEEVKDSANQPSVKDIAIQALARSSVTDRIRFIETILISETGIMMGMPFTEEEEDELIKVIATTKKETEQIQSWLATNAPRLIPNLSLIHVAQTGIHLLNCFNLGPSANRPNLKDFWGLVSLSDKYWHTVQTNPVFIAAQEGFTNIYSKIEKKIREFTVPEVMSAESLENLVTLCEREPDPEEEIAGFIKSATTKLIETQKPKRLPLVLNALRENIRSLLVKTNVGDQAEYNTVMSILFTWVAKQILFGNHKDPRPLHLGIMNIYRVSDFSIYPPNKSIEVSGYRLEMLMEIYTKLGLNTPEANAHLYSLGAGDLWMELQLNKKGIKVSALELSDENIKAAKARIKADLISKGVAESEISEDYINSLSLIDKGSWDDIASWDAFKNSDATTKIVTILGRSLSHEESEEIFVATLSNIYNNLNPGDYLFLDMPDPTSGTYAEDIKLLKDRLIALGATAEEVADLEYLIDSPDFKNYYNRYTPTEQKLLDIYKRIGFEVVDPSSLVSQSKDSPNSQSLLDSVSNTCIREIIPAPQKEDWMTEEYYTQLQQRRNMVFLLRKPQAADKEKTSDLPHPATVTGHTTRTESPATTHTEDNRLVTQGLLEKIINTNKDKAQKKPGAGQNNNHPTPKELYDLVLTQSKQKPLLVQTMADIITRSPDSLYYLSNYPYHGNRESKEKPSSIKFFKLLLELLPQQSAEPNQHSKKSLCIHFINTLGEQHKVGGYTWVNGLVSSLRLEDSELWTKQMAVEATEYEFYKSYTQLIVSTGEFRSQFRKLAKGLVNTYTVNNQTGEVVTRRSEDKQLLNAINKLKQFIPKSTDTQFSDSDNPSEYWRAYESNLLKSLQEIDKDGADWRALTGEIDKLLHYLAGTEARSYQTPLPLCLNALRDNLLNEFKRKLTSEGIREFDNTLTVNYKQTDENILVSYLAIRRLMFPHEDINQINPSSTRIHLDLDSVYEVANFANYSESKQLKETQYRINMLKQVFTNIAPNNQQLQIYELGSGDGWLSQQLVESTPYQIHTQEISPEQIKEAEAKRASLENALQKRLSITQGTWDKLDKWQQLKDRDKNIPACFLWLGRSASHEESESSFMATLYHFTSNMLKGDHLVMDMPDPETGTYYEFRKRMVDALNEIGKNLNPAAQIKLEDFDFLVDSPDGVNFYNRFTPSYKRLSMLFSQMGLELVPVQLDEDTGKDDFRKFDQDSDPKLLEERPGCIIERVNSTPYPDQDMNNRRNMVFVLKKISDPPGFMMCNKSGLLQSPGQRG